MVKRLQHIDNKAGTLSNYYTYSYDNLNRLTAGNANTGNNENNISYDGLGNITGLSRSGIASHNLTYGYTGNQLNTVTGYSPRSYAYDANGNATSDGISKSISYNFLNLPGSVGNVATYTYDANGTKLGNTGSDGSWDYDDGIVYNNGTIKYITNEEGRATQNGGIYTYQYDLKDQLGDVRVTFDSNNGTARVLQEDEYYAFGLRHSLYDNSNNNRHLYNGKEIQTDLANQYDYGARFYDPVIGRMTSIDPKAELNRKFSPFVYGNDNPIRFIDPDGMFSTDVTENKDGTYKVVAAKADGDKRVYVQNSNGQRTGQVIGQTVTDHSFLDDNGKAVTGATINLSDKSGASFLKNLMGDKNLSLTGYMKNATGGGKYDFKTNGIADRAKGETTDQYKYRGGVVDGVAGLSGGGGLPTIASGRDIGNIGAGFITGSNGISWSDARLGFDALQSYQQGQIATEGQTTQLAERVGYGLGVSKFNTEHPFKSLFKIDSTLPIH